MIHNQEKEDAGKKQSEQEPEVRQEDISLPQRIILPVKPALDHAIPDTAGKEVAQTAQRFRHGLIFRIQQPGAPYYPEKNGVFEKRDQRCFCPDPDVFSDAALPWLMKIPGIEEKRKQHGIRQVGHHIFDRPRYDQVKDHNPHHGDPLDHIHIVQTLLRVHPNHCLPEGSLPSIYYTRKRLFRQRLFHAKPADALSVRCRKSKDVFAPSADSVKKLDNSETLGYNMKQLQKFKQHVKRRTPYEHAQ